MRFRPIHVDFFFFEEGVVIVLRLFRFHFHVESGLVARQYTCNGEGRNVVFRDAIQVRSDGFVFLGARRSLFVVAIGVR